MSVGCVGDCGDESEGCNQCSMSQATGKSLLSAGAQRSPDRSSVPCGCFLLHLPSPVFLTPGLLCSPSLEINNPVFPWDGAGQSSSGGVFL